MKTIIPETIESVEDAKKFLTELYNNDESYHPEDSAFDIIIFGSGERLFTNNEAAALDSLMINHIDGFPGFDPCEWLLFLEQTEKCTMCDEAFAESKKYMATVGTTDHLICKGCKNFY